MQAAQYNGESSSASNLSMVSFDRFVLPSSDWFIYRRNSFVFLFCLGLCYRFAVALEAELSYPGSCVSPSRMFASLVTSGILNLDQRKRRSKGDFEAYRPWKQIPA
jgi:hypothetical protein